MSHSDENRFKLQDLFWDAIVIGTGMGGSTLGYALAKGGKKVLFLERGFSHLTADHKPILGEFPEKQFKNLTRIGPEEKSLLKRAGRYSRAIIDQATGKKFIPLIGEGTGGSTALYGAALERFFPMDFAAKNLFPEIKDSSLVDWPLTFTDYLPYYDQAEKLFEVRGSPDPLRLDHQSTSLRKASLSSAGNRLFQNWRSQGLHPYRLTVGHVPKTEGHCPGCQGTICRCGEKSDAARICLLPAIKDYGAVLLDNCEVLELTADRQKILAIKCRRDDLFLTFMGAQIFLAAGALETPRLLLKAKSKHWPQGLANDSGQVGKNLSRHFMDLYMASVPHRNGENLFEKELAMNDFYYYQGKKLGTVQSLGNPPEVKAALAEMHSEIWAKGSVLEKLYYFVLATFGKYVMSWIFKKKICIAAIMDDVSYTDNQVSLAADGDTLVIRYEIRPEAFERLKLFRSLILKSFRPYSVQLHKQGENNQRLAHASGTCRMGQDPKTSVVDTSNKAHGLENLYIVDASFFPTGSGINPALTIAANSLRIAELLLKE